MGKFIDISGNKYGKLTVIEKVNKENKNITYWLCECECGNKKTISKPNLTTGHSKSCGCLAIESATGNKYGLKHNESKTRLYFIWQSMKQRCYDKNVNGYKYYGLRGIEICNDWLDYEKFSEWSKGNGYKNNLSIDRIDVNGNYEPENCRFITAKQQNRNKTTSVFITYFGIKKCVSEWSEILGIPQTTIHNRMKKHKDASVILNVGYLKKGIETATPEELNKLILDWGNK